ncbi:MAG: hypothetical protein QM489_00755 [Candidatus Izemoplasma sp.]
MKYKCHNCNETDSTLLKFLKKHVNSLYSEYLLEITRGNSRESKKEPIKYNKSKLEESKKRLEKTKKYLDPATIFDSVNSSQIALNYLKTRKIPDKYFEHIFYTERFKEITNKLIPGKFANNEEFGNKYIVFPLITSEGKMIGYQGRSLTCKDKAFRYITIAFNKERNPPIFGQNFVDLEKKVWILEGPIDSLFLSNSIALCGAGKTLDLTLFPNRVYVLDPDTRNQQIKIIYKKLIKQGESIVILPKKYSGLDTNDLVLQGIDAEQLYTKYTFVGFKAQLELAKWNR